MTSNKYIETMVLPSLWQDYFFRPFEMGQPLVIKMCTIKQWHFVNECTQEFKVNINYGEIYK